MGRTRGLGMARYSRRLWPEIGVGVGVGVGWYDCEVASSGDSRWSSRMRARGYACTTRQSGRLGERGSSHRKDIVLVPAISACATILHTRARAPLRIAELEHDPYGEEHVHAELEHLDCGGQR